MLLAAIELSSVSLTSEDATLHPVLGKKPPREVLNKDLLALPEGERLAWIHASAAISAQLLVNHDNEVGKCVLAHFFLDGNWLQAVPKWMEKYPEQAATATIYAAMRNACPGA